MQLSFRSKVATATVMVTAIWVGAVAVIITDGAEAEDIIMVGATIAITGDCVILLGPPQWRPRSFSQCVPNREL